MVFAVNQPICQSIRHPAGLRHGADKLLASAQVPATELAGSLGLLLGRKRASKTCTKPLFLNEEKRKKVMPTVL
ncbi:MAG: hypothetical protein ACRYG7_20670 [Janthinobacterium lividum]